MQALPELSWTSCPKLDKKFHPFSAVLRPDLPMAVDLKVARVVVANMGGEIIVTMAAEAAVEAATVEAATVEAATVEAAGADMEAVRVGIRKMKETKSQLAVLLVFFVCVVNLNIIQEKYTTLYTSSANAEVIYRCCCCCCCCFRASFASSVW
jgi:hypothetical protein